MIPRNLSYSQIKSWLECRQQWAYKYRDGYRPNRPKIEFTRGTLIHLGIEHKVTEDISGGPCGEHWWVKALKEWHAEWGPILGDDMIVAPDWFEGCKFIVEKAAEVFHQDWEVVEDERGPVIERRMYARLSNWYKGVVFIPDVVGKRRTGKYAGGVFGVDFKTFGKAKEQDYGDLDLQGAIYQRGLCEKGYPAIGSCLFQIVQEPPKEPRINKDGSVHAADAKSALTWAPVRDQQMTTRSPEFLDGVWTRVVEGVAAEMHEAETAGARMTPCMNYYSCKFCEFREPCLALLKGHDSDAILASEFSQRVKR